MRGEVRGEVRDVRDHPAPPGTTAAVLTESPTAVVAGALGAVQVLAGLRHGLAVHRGSQIEIIFFYSGAEFTLVSPWLYRITRVGPGYTEHSAEKIGSENNSLMSLENILDLKIILS